MVVCPSRDTQEVFINRSRSVEGPFTVFIYNNRPARDAARIYSFLKEFVSPSNNHSIHTELIALLKSLNLGQSSPFYSKPMSRKRTGASSAPSLPKEGRLAHHLNPCSPFFVRPCRHRSHLEAVYPSADDQRLRHCCLLRRRSSRRRSSRRRTSL